MKEFIEKLAEALDLIDTELILPSTRLVDLEGWSSLVLVQVVVFFDEEYGKNVSIDTLRRCVTINDLYDLTLQ